MLLVQQKSVHVYEFARFSKMQLSLGPQELQEGPKYNAVDPKYPLTAVADICTTETAVDLR